MGEILEGLLYRGFLGAFSGPQGFTLPCDGTTRRDPLVAPCQATKKSAQTVLTKMITRVRVPSPAGKCSRFL
jgi:hypothetical protein